MEKVKTFDKIAEYKVHVTNDFSRFKILEGNREIGLIGFIKKQIQKYGYLWLPILVNEHWEVIDGQHRLEACRELGIPIHYIKQPGLRLEHCQALNAGRRNWTAQNYIHAGAVDSADYGLFEILTKKHPDMPLNVVWASYGNRKTGSNIKSILKNGTLKCSEKDFYDADKVLAWLEKFLPDMDANRIRGAAKSRFLYALIFAWHHPLINVRDLTSRMHDNMSMMKQHLLTAEDCVIGIETVYNYKCRKENRVDLLPDYRRRGIK